MKMLPAATFVVAALCFAAPAVHAQSDGEYSKKSDVTFSAPVHLPSFDLAPGTYRFELAEPVMDRKVIRVSSADGKKVYGLLLTVTDETNRVPQENEPLVLFDESANGAPRAVRAWFYPGERIGYEIVYPHSEALALARANHSRVRAMNSDKSDRASLNGAKVGWVDQSGDVNGNGAAATSGTTEPPAATDKK
ncbi:MAG TPA: hypothetical protein VHZ73_03570 [Vicinamibacterales bacterium]|jgi:hypothetical protein|nr:hypothetical protein [Vicinamibacterales bacterium]